MSILDKIFKTTGKLTGLDGFLHEIGETARQVLPNEQARREFDLALRELGYKYSEILHKEALAQAEVNKVEAAHRSLFVAGWRPFIGWVCGAGLAWNFVAAPALSIFGLRDMLMLNLEYLITMVVTMLGSSGLRTFEKLKGVSTMPEEPAQPAQLLRQPPPQPQPEGALLPEGDAPWNR